MTENQETGLSIQYNTLLEANKDRISDIAKSVVHNIQQGETDALRAYIAVKKGSELFKQLEENIKPYAVEKANPPKGGGLEMYSCKIEQTEVGLKYDYAHCEDPEWEALNDTITRLTAEKKEREKFLQALKKDHTYVDEETGDIVTIHPPVKSGQMSIKTTIK